jgi:tRNA-specific 2-thiouridylase
VAADRPTALALFSGGLDSQLAVCLVRQQGVDVSGIHVVSVFWEGGVARVRQAAAEIELELTDVEASPEMIDLVKAPPHGYGRRVNPCLDCKILMLSHAKCLMEEMDCQFLVTGEVLGQRPMSQRKDSFPLLEKAAGVRGLVVRPLSGRLLPPTIPEERGWIARAGLLALRGRTRKPQLSMVSELGLRQYSTPAGGCSLTEPGFSARMRDLLEGKQPWGIQDVRLLRLGRHFRLTPTCKLVVGRNKRENDLLEIKLVPGDLKLEARGVRGPVALLRGRASSGDLEKSMAVVARYCDRTEETADVVAMTSEGVEVQRRLVAPLTERELSLVRVQ